MPVAPGDSAGYRLGYGEGHTVDGPYTQEFYTWMEVDDWPTWERQLAYGPYIHHCSCSYGHCADVLEEARRLAGDGFSGSLSISGDTVGTFTSSGTIATLETTANGRAFIKCVSGEVSATCANAFVIFSRSRTV